MSQEDFCSALMGGSVFAELLHRLLAMSRRALSIWISRSNPQMIPIIILESAGKLLNLPKKR
jgi:hypothetical protein